MQSVKKERSGLYWPSFHMYQEWSMHDHFHHIGIPFYSRQEISAKTRIAKRTDTRPYIYLSKSDVFIGKEIDGAVNK